MQTCFILTAMSLLASIKASSSGSGSTTDAVVRVPFLEEMLATKPLLPNWVHSVDPPDDACYRKLFTNCPLNFPVKCGFVECIQQNAGCGSHMTGNVQAAATVVMSAATAGMFGQLKTVSKNVERGVKCGQQLFSTVTDIVAYTEELQNNSSNLTQQQIISQLEISSIVVKDLPVAVSVCLGLDTPTEYMDLATGVVVVVNKVIAEVVNQGSSLLSANQFITFIKNIGAGQAIDANDTAVLTRLISEGETCGTELQSAINKVTHEVAAIKGANPSARPNEIRVILGKSELYLHEIPTVTNNCIQNVTGDAYAVRDEIRKALSVITDHLISATEDSKGHARSTADYFFNVKNLGLDVIALFDPTGIAAMLKEYIQPICSTTDFIGEVDDGSLVDALALRAKGAAFAGSYGNWTQAGDGIVNVRFESSDDKDVTVVIRSAGNTVGKVKVGSGKTVIWSSTVANLQNKAMYFDRWRPGMFNIAGSGGGSLVLWVPGSSTGGHIELVAQINVS